MTNIWDNIIDPPLTDRSVKPRYTGISMILDKGLSLMETEALLATHGQFIDFLKLSFGTIALYDPVTLSRKIELATEYGIAVYPGGTFLEIAFWQGRFERCLKKLRELKLSWVEISDGTITLVPAIRTSLIATAISFGFQVLSEIGKKDPANQLDESLLIETARLDLEAGATWVIVEARESGKSIGVYDHQGTIISEKLEKLSQGLPVSKLIWEAPLKSQQAALINHFGSGVNLGNIAPGDVLALEALRQGFRSDTWKSVLEHSFDDFLFNPLR